MRRLNIFESIRLYIWSAKRSGATDIMAQGYEEMNEEAGKLLVDFSKLDQESLKFIP